MKITCPNCQGINKIKTAHFGWESENCETCGYYLWDKTKDAPHIAFFIMNALLVMGGVEIGLWQRSTDFLSIPVGVIVLFFFMVLGWLLHTLIVKCCIYCYLNPLFRKK